MITNNATQKQNTMRKKVEVVGTIVGIVIGLFTVVQVITQQPVIALIVTLLGAIIASAYFARRKYVVETILAWLIAVVIGLLVFVLFPRSMTITGTVYDAKDSPICNEPVILIDSTGLEYRTKTDQEGRYEFREIHVGAFEVKVKDIRTGGEGNRFIGPEIVVYVPATPTCTPAPTATATPTHTPTTTPTPTATSTKAPTETPTQIPTATPTAAPTDIATPSIKPTSVFCKRGGNGGTETVPVAPQLIRGIRIDLTRRALTEYAGFSLWEVEIYGPGTGNLASVEGVIATASTWQDSFGCEDCRPGKAIDNDISTRWSSDFKEPQWLEIALPAPRSADRIVLRWEAAYAKEYCVTLIK